MYLIKLFILLANDLFLLLDKCLIVFPAGHGIFTLVISRPFLFFQIEFRFLGGVGRSLFRQSDLHLSLEILQLGYGVLHTFEPLLPFFHAHIRLLFWLMFIKIHLLLEILQFECQIVQLIIQQVLCL